MVDPAELAKKLKKKAQDQLRADKLGRVGRRRGIKATPTTAQRGVRMIKLRQRQAQTVELRLKNFSYREIGEVTGVRTSQAERDLAAGIKDIVPVESAEKVLQLESARLDALAAGHFEAACKGSVSHAHCMLRIIELRAKLFGLLDHDRAGAAARVILTEHGDSPRSMAVEFILPGRKSAVDLGNLPPSSPRQAARPVQPDQQHGQQPQRTRIQPLDSDVVVERVLPSALEKPHGSYDWMK
jgi:hypothetical protein